MTIPSAAFPLHVSGSSILGADASHVRLAGVNWGGAQQDELLPYGLDKLPRSQIIARIISWGFNHVRFPFALGTFVGSNGVLKTGLAKASRLTANPDLIGLTPWQVFQQLVDDMTAAGLYVILNQHLLYQGWCCSEVDTNGLWYNSNWPASVFTNVWAMLAARFAANPRVGYDLHNEPRKATIAGQVAIPSWGKYPNTDIRQMYQNTIAKIRVADTDALCFCEGLSYASDLTGWKAYPVTGPGVVASAHDYSWFHTAGQTQASYFTQMDKAMGYLVTQGIAPLWVGEFGANTDVNTAAMHSGWLPNFIAYAAARGLHWCWWELGSTAVLGTEPSTNAVKMQPGQREAFSLTAGQDWTGTQTDMLAMLAPILS